MTNEMSIELLGVGIEILEGMAFLSSNYSTADAAMMFYSSQGEEEEGWGVLPPASC